MKKTLSTIMPLITLVCLLSCDNVAEISYKKMGPENHDYNYVNSYMNYGLDYKAKFNNGLEIKGGQGYRISLLYCGTEQWAAYMPWENFMERSYSRGQVGLDELVSYNVIIDKDKNVEIEIDITFLISEDVPKIKRTEKNAFEEIFKFIDKSLSENHSKSKVFSFQLDTLIDDGKPMVKYHKKISYSTMNDSILVIKTKEVNNKIDTNYINNKFDYFSIEEQGNVPDSFRVKIRDEKLNVDLSINR